MHVLIIGRARNENTATLGEGGTMAEEGKQHVGAGAFGVQAGCFGIQSRGY